MPAFAQTCTPVSSSGLIGHWKFDETTGLTTADSSGNGHTGTLRNGTLRSTDMPPQVTPNVRSVQFDGADDDVQVAGSNDFNLGTSNFTVSGFARTTAGDRSVLGNFSAAHRGWGLYFYATNRVNFFGYGDLGTNDASQAGVVLDDQWHHVAGVYTRTGPSLTIDTYVDGALVGTNTAVVGDITANSDLLFGHYLGQPNYQGKLDDVRVYTRALSGSEVASLASGCNPPPMCHDQTATIYVQNGVIVGGPNNGQNYNGNIVGTPGNDVIVGPPDSSVNVFGNGGNDTICTGSANDTVSTTSGNDWIDAGDGNNSVGSGGGNDTIRTGSGNDSVTAGSGTDSCSLGGGYNTSTGCENP
jgi:hypothetical protein